MFQYKCLNPISQTGLGLFGEEYKQTEELNDADAVLVRSAKMHDMELPENVKVIARAGAGVNNIPVEQCAENGIVVFNTPGANANGVKELVLAGMLLASRDIVGGIEWVAHEEDKEHIDKLAEKQKKAFVFTYKGENDVEKQHTFFNFSPYLGTQSLTRERGPITTAWLEDVSDSPYLEDVLPADRTVVYWVDTMIFSLSAEDL